jgi:hypothetical protein
MHRVGDGARRSGKGRIALVTPVQQHLKQPPAQALTPEAGPDIQLDDRELR